MACMFRIVYISQRKRRCALNRIWCTNSDENSIEPDLDWLGYNDWIFVMACSYMLSVEDSAVVRYDQELLKSHFTGFVRESY